MKKKTDNWIRKMAVISEQSAKESKLKNYLFKYVPSTNNNTIRYWPAHCILQQ